MKTPTLNAFLDVLDEVGRTTLKLVRRGVHVIAGMSWPAMAVTCVAVALAITIVPLALFLFLVFMLIKLLVAATIVGARRDKPLTKHGQAE